jgi:hypothetical protein
MRPAPKLIDPNLLNKVNEVYIAKTQQSNSILVWLYETIGYYIKQNILFSVVVIGLVGFLLYRYIENIKRKNKILKNLNSDKPIKIKLEKPIDYNNNPKPTKQGDNKPTNDEIVLSEISVNVKQEFDKDIENDLKLVNDPNDTKISQNPTQNEQQQEQQPQQFNPLTDRMPMVDPKIDPMQPQYRSSNTIGTNVIGSNAIEGDNMGEIDMQTGLHVLHKSNIPHVESTCGIAQVKEAKQPKCGFQGKKNAYIEKSRSSKSEQSKNSSKLSKKDKKVKKSNKLIDDKSYIKKKDRKKYEEKHKNKNKNKRSRRERKKKERTPKRDRHEEEILNIFERELAITNGSIQRERKNKESKFRTNIMENQDTYDGPSALNTFSDNFMAFV